MDETKAFDDACASNLVSLREISAQTVRAVTDLSTTDEQRVFIAPNAVSLAEALFAPEAWYRAIYFQDQIAGFVMLYDETLRAIPPAEPELWVWRLMVDSRFQRRGVGRAAMLRVIEHARTKGVAVLQLSYVQAPGNPEPFYRSLGFRRTDRLQDGELVLELPLRNIAIEPFRQCGDWIAWRRVS